MGDFILMALTKFPRCTFQKISAGTSDPLTRRHGLLPWPVPFALMGKALVSLTRLQMRNVQLDL